MLQCPFKCHGEGGETWTQQTGNASSDLWTPGLAAFHRCSQVCYQGLRPPPTKKADRTEE